MNNTVKRLTLGSACAITLGMASAIAMAQEGQYGDPTQQHQDPATQQYQQQGADPYGAHSEQAEVSDDRLKTYAEAEEKVQEIRNEVQEQMPNADTPEQAQEMQQEAQEKMVSAVEDAGLSVEEYNQIATLIQTNPTLRDRLEELR